MNLDNPYMREARLKWGRARRQALWSRLLPYIQSGGETLLDFNQVARRFKLKNAIYRGLQNVPLNKIVGSAGRYNDFTRTFLPIREEIGERWQRVAAMQIDPRKGLPPVDLYKVGEWYFVYDGNHRVSVSRQLDQPDIEAYVWEYTEALPDIGPGVGINKLLIEAERLDFQEQTGLDMLRPGNDICLSEPGGYTEMLCWIQDYQGVLDKIDGTQTSYADAVTAWYDMIYETSIQIIKRDGVMELFPERSETDFFVWLIHHHEELSERYGRHVPFGDAIQDFSRYRLLARIAHTVRRVLQRRKNGDGAMRQ